MALLTFVFSSLGSVECRRIRPHSCVTKQISNSFYGTKGKLPRLNRGMQAPRSNATFVVYAAATKRVLVVNTESGGHAFIGDYLARDLVNAGHEVTFLKKGGKPATRLLPFQTPAEFEEVSSALNVLTGNIEDEAEVKGLLNGRSFDVVIDNAFKEVKHTAAIVDATKHSSPHFIYVSSAGMYKASDEMPHIEGDPVDQKSSKYLTEVYLNGTGLPVTHIRPVYVFGPLNYRDIEAWFWDRILSDRPVPIPGSGAQITNLGHVEDFVQAVTAIINKPEVSAGQIYNISGRKFTTLDGLTKMAAKVAGKLDTLKIVHYNSKDFDLPKGKAFPLREKHFFIETNKAHQELGWDALHGLEDGLAESLLYYLSAGRPNAPNFTIDETILSKSA